MPTRCTLLSIAAAAAPPNSGMQAVVASSATAAAAAAADDDSCCRYHLLLAQSYSSHPCPTTLRQPPGCILLPNSFQTVSVKSLPSTANTCCSIGIKFTSDNPKNILK